MTANSAGSRNWSAIIAAGCKSTEKLAHAETAPLGEIPVSDTTSADVVDQVAELLGKATTAIQVSKSE